MNLLPKIAVFFLLLWLASCAHDGQPNKPIAEGTLADFRGTTEKGGYAYADMIEVRPGHLWAVLAKKIENPGVPGFCQSFDGGKTWTNVVPLPNYSKSARFSSFHHVNVLGFPLNDGRKKYRIVVVMQAVNPKVDTIPVEGGMPYSMFSDDFGKTWQSKGPHDGKLLTGEASPMIPQALSPMQDTQYLAVSSRNMTRLSNGHILLPLQAVYYAGKGEKTKLNLLKSEDDGLSWRWATEWFNLHPFSKVRAVGPCVAALPDGRVLMTIRTDTGYIYKSISKDFGATWSKPVSTGLASPYTAHTLRVTPEGWLLLAYTESAAPDPRFLEDRGMPRNNITTVVSKDGGQTWVNKKTIVALADDKSAQRPEIVMQPSIAFSRGNVIITYLHTRYRMAPDGKGKDSGFVPGVRYGVWRGIKN